MSLITQIKMLAIAAFVGALPSGQAQAQQVNLIDFVILQDGVDIAERDAYEEGVKPIAAKYGANVVHSYDLFAHMIGSMKNAVRLNVWNLDHANALGALEQDPAYQKMVSNRDRIHDMSALTLYMGQEITSVGPIKDGFILVDLVVMNGGMGDAERDAYEAKMAPLAKKYGYEIRASYRIMQKISGEGPDRALRLNLWRGETPNGLERLNKDSDYIALENERNTITDFSQLALFMAKPRG